MCAAICLHRFVCFQVLVARMLWSSITIICFLSKFITFGDSSNSSERSGAIYYSTCNTFPKNSMFIIIIIVNNCPWFVVHLFFDDRLAVRQWHYNLCRQGVAVPRLYLVWNCYVGWNWAFRVTHVCVWYHKMLFAVVDTKEIPYI
jgi:hypothetical protein